MNASHNPVAGVLAARRQQFAVQSADRAAFEPLLAFADSLYSQANPGQRLSQARKDVLLNTLDQQTEVMQRKHHDLTKEKIVSMVLSQADADKLVRDGFIKSAPTIAENPQGVDNPVAMLYNLLSVLVPNFAYMEAAAVQPMPTEQAPIFYPNLIANTARNGVAVGDSLLSPTVWNSNNWYTSNRYKIGSVSPSTGQTLVNYTVPIVPILPSQNVGGSAGATPNITIANFVITIVIAGSPNTTYITTDDGRGAIIPIPTILTSGTINYATGDVSYTMASNVAAGDTHSYDYRFDLDQNTPVQAIFEFSSKQLVAYPRRIRSKYALDNFYAAKKVLQNYNLDEVMSSSLAGYINKEISGGVFDNMSAASSAVYTWSSTLPSGVSWAFHRLSVLLPIVQAKNAIRKNTARHGGNVMVCGTSLINVIETLGSDLWTPKKFEREPIGPYVAGTLAGSIKVIKNQDYADNNNIMCFKADDTDASYTVGVFIGLYATDPLAMDDLQVIQGLGTKIGETLVFSNSIVTIQYT